MLIVFSIASFAAASRITGTALLYVSKATENVTKNVNENPVTTASKEENNSISDEVRENDAAIVSGLIVVA
jgi:hypothetical protein